MLSDSEAIKSSMYQYSVPSFDFCEIEFDRIKSKLFKFRKKNSLVNKIFVLFEIHYLIRKNNH